MMDCKSSCTLPSFRVSRPIADVDTQASERVSERRREKPPAVACKSASQAGSAGVLVSSDGAGAKWKPFGAMRMRGSWLIEGGVARRPNSDLLQLFRTKKGEIYQVPCSAPLRLARLPPPLRRSGTLASR